MTHARHRCPTILALSTAVLLPAMPALAQQQTPGMVQQDGERAGTLLPLGEAGSTVEVSPSGDVIRRTNVPGNEQQLVGRAAMRNAQGAALGTVAFVETANGLLLQVRLENVPPGGHAIHVHETGRCEPPDFKSAGGHYNPSDVRHGYLSRFGAHAGDLPNVYAMADGTVRADLLTKQLQLQPGVGSLLPSGSRALVVHAGVDDYQTDPAGASGDRIACGVIEVPAGAPGETAVSGSPAGQGEAGGGRSP